jgi:meckelin
MKAVGVMLTLSVSLGCCWELVVAQDGGAAPSPLPLTLHETCREIGAVFQSGNLSCAQCAASSEPALDGLSCECLGNATRAAGDVSSSSPSCSPCPSGQAVSGDGLYCVECTPPLTFDPSTQSCSPCPSKLFIYLDTHPSLSGYPGNRTCVLCPPGTWIDQSGFSCAECGLGNCSQCLEPHNGRCFPSPLPSPPSDSFNYYTQHFTAAVGLCRYGNQEACQRLINLCVLQKYLKSDPACAEVLASSSSSFLPPLYYPSRGADELLADVSFSDSLYTSPHSQGVSRLPLMVAMFALNGSFLGLHDVSQQLLICRDLPPRYQDAWKVGVQYEVDCLVGVASLSSSHLTFLDLYWRDRSDVLHSVPVLPRDYVEGESGEGVNRGDERGAWQLVTRFFLSEAVSSAPRYAHYITLRMRLDSGGRVLTPYLIVDYVEWERDPQSTDSLRAGFAVDYSQDVSSFNITMSVFVVVMAILVGVACGLRLNSFLRRTGDLCCTVPAYVFTVVEFSGLMSSCLFLLLSISSTVILILYKGQTLFVYTLPTGSQLLVFQIMLPLTLLGRLISVVHTIWGQCNIDIFLIDWERPSTARQQPTNQIAGHQPPMGGMVSIWRTYFVANEWNELQTLRRGLRPLSTLIAGLLFLQVIGLRHLAESDPTGHVTTSSWRYSAPHSPLLRFSLTSLVFTALAVSMRLYVVLFHERFVEDKIHQFIDLCSVSNVSVFIMWRRCYGYYIEGRSVHGRADINMREMSDNLQKEQARYPQHNRAMFSLTMDMT